MRIKPRTALSTLIDVMKAFNDEQKKAVDELGFKIFRENFNVLYVPTLLGQWVVEKYDPTIEKFNLGAGKEIKVNADAIHGILGVPMGTKKIKLVERARESDPTTAYWRKQFNIENNRFYIKYLVNTMMQQQEADFNFKLNFVVLFATIMGECISCGTVNQRFLPSVKNEEDLKDLDWCSFLLNCMNTTRQNWNLKANFNGPLVLMVLLYVNSTFEKEVKVYYDKPAIKYWDTDKLDNREDFEMDSGGFGKTVVLKSEMAKLTKKAVSKTESPGVNAKDNEPIINLKRKSGEYLKQKMKKKKVTFKKSEKIFLEKDLAVKETVVEEQLKDSQDTYGTQELVNQLCTPTLKIGVEGLSSCYDEDGVFTGSSKYDPKTLETYKKALTTKLQLVEDLRGEVNEMLKKALGLFPGDAGLKIIENMAKEIFVSEKKESEVVKKGKEVVERSADKGVDNLRYEGPSFSIGLTQLDEINEREDNQGMGNFSVIENLIKNTPLLSTEDQPKNSETLKNVDKGKEKVASEGGNGKELEVNDATTAQKELRKFVTPSEKLTLRKSPQIEKKEWTNVLAVSPINVAYPKEAKKNEPPIKDKRECQPSLSMISPYLARPVSLKKAQAAIEKRMSESIFSTWKNPNDTVFSSHNIDLERIMLENMIPGLAIANNTLDVWTLVLNNEESKRDRSKCSRLFCNTSMLSENVMTQIDDNVKKAIIFAQNMDDVLISSPFGTLDDVDLVFFPNYMSEKRHFYLIVFNLKNCEIYIVDNIKSGEDVCKRYGDAPKELTRVFTEYLTSKKHKSAIKLMTAKQIQLKMSWRTVKNSIDCGIFVMRHMETFKGPSDFETEFKKEGATQQRQLNDLRVKYVTKILLSDLNEKKKEMIKEAEEYESLPAEEKESLKKGALEKISETVKEFVVDY